MNIQLIKKNSPDAYMYLQLCKTFIRSIIVRFFSCRNRELINYKNKHSGKRCFIVATGPSLNADDLEMLRNEFSFGVNGCINMLEKTNWKPDYMCFSDKDVCIRLYDSIMENGSKIDNIFISQDIKGINLDNVVKYIKDTGPSVYVATEYYKKLRKKYRYLDFYLSDRPDFYFCDGNTVVYIVLQLAIYMGFDEIYLLGTDCNYKSSVQYSSLAECKWKVDDLDIGEKLFYGYEVIKREIEEKGLKVKIYNATRGGMLEVFQRQNLEEVLRRNEKNKTSMEK